MTTYHLATRFAEAVERYGARECLVAGRQRRTYAQVDADAAGFANALRDLGVRTGDRLAVDLPNWSDWIVTLLSAARLGAVVGPVNPSVGYHELKYQLRHAEASVAIGAQVVGDAEYLETFEELLADLPDLRHLVMVGPDEMWYDDRIFQFADLVARGRRHAPTPAADVDEGAPLALIYTSGTMGKPKGVVLSHRNLVETALRTAEVLGVGAADRVLCAVPLFTVFGVQVVLTTCSRAARG